MHDRRCGNLIPHAAGLKLATPGSYYVLKGNENEFMGGHKK
jgi:hypothetical protein